MKIIINHSVQLGLLSIAAGVMPVHHAAAAYISGGDLYQLCSKDSAARQNFDYALCLGYISGVVDVMSNNNKNDGLEFCVRDFEVPQDRLRRIVLSFLDGLGSKASDPAWIYVVAALQPAFPCK